jgi:hypothetical protein
MTTTHDDVRVRNATLLRSFDRSLRNRNRVDRTRQSYPEAAGLLIDFRPAMGIPRAGGSPAPTQTRLCSLRVGDHGAAGPSVRHDHRSGRGDTWAKEANREQRR